MDGEQVFGRYKLLELLARGGMAEVYKAKSHGIEGFEKLVVLKRILPVFSEDPRFVELFINEAKIACSLSHRNIVQVFDLGVVRGTHFIAMEYVDGPDLRTVIRALRERGERVPRELAVFVATEVAKALDFAHRQRDNRGPRAIVHQDVSPQNILLSRDGEVKLTDFGIAVAAGAHDADRPRGKFAYMAPEQVHGGSVDRRTDVFSLAVVLYEALSGQNPLERQSTPGEAARLVERGAIPWLSSIDPEIPRELSNVIARALAYDPADRPATAQQFHDEILEHTYAPAAGMRIGSHDLAEFVIGLLEKEKTQPGVEEASRIFKAVLELPLDSEEGAEPTLVEYSRSYMVRATRDVTIVVLRANADERFDPAHVHEVASRSGGTVVLDDGEGIEAAVLFGAKHADGRDRESAASFALQTSRVLRGASKMAETQVRIAIDVASVLVDPRSEPVHDAAMAAALARTFAITDAGRSDEIHVTRAVHDAIRSRFRLAPAGENFVLGSERSMHDGYGRFVGRRETLRAMAETLGRTQGADGPVLAILGEEGSGKSRLLSEVARRLARGTHDVGFFVASCTRRMRDASLSGVLEMFRALLGIDDLDPLEERRAKVARVRELGLSETEHTSIATLLGVAPANLASGELPAGQLLLHAARKLAEDRPSVFAWDGAENLDEDSRRALATFVNGTPGTRIAVLFACRSGYERVLHALPRYETLSLEPLGVDEVRALIASRLGASVVPESLVASVARKSHGNPLFVETYLDALLDAGAARRDGPNIAYDERASEVAVPSSLRAIVASRVAQLPPMQRELLRVAAVARSGATAELLAAVFGESPSAMGVTLTNLERAGVLARQGSSEYAFAHELVRHVVLDGLSDVERRDAHVRLAGAIARVHPDRVEELAHHFRGAGDLARAVDQWVRFADEQAHRRSLEGVVHGLTRAVEALRETSSEDLERLCSLSVRLSEVHRGRREHATAESVLAAALEPCEARGYKSGVARIAGAQARVRASLARFDEAEEALVRARRAMRGSVDRVVRRDVALATAEVRAARGDHDHALRAYEETLTLVRDALEPHVAGRCHLGIAREKIAQRDFEAARVALENAARFAQSDRALFSEISLAKALEACAREDYVQAARLANRGLEEALEAHLTEGAIEHASLLGEALLRRGDHRAAFRAVRQCFELATEHGHLAARIHALSLLGFIDAIKLGSGEGRRNVQRALDHAESEDFILAAMNALYLLAMIDARLGDTDSARRSLERAIAHGARFESSPLVRAARTAFDRISAGDAILLPPLV